MRSIILVALLLSVAPARANPRALPFTYTTDTLAAGEAELEQFVDLVPLRALSPATTAHQLYVASQFQTELEIGLTERLELGLYVTFVPGVSPELLAGTAKLPEGNGLKQRLRYGFAQPGTWPIDVGVYGEISENEREIEVEAKLLLQRRFDRVRIAANIAAEYELYFDHQRDVALSSSLGATYEASPKLHVGLESWLRGEYPRNPRPAMRTFGLGPVAYLGPAVMYNFGRVWWSVAAYARMTDISHVVVPGEPYGRFWFRSMIGYEL
jgi:hypothetical protein